MFHNRTWPLSEFAYRTQRYRVYSLNGTPSGPVEEAIYNGQNAAFTSFAEILNGQNSSFTTYQRTIIQPDANGNYPVEEA